MSDPILLAPPDPGPAATIDGLAERLRLLKIWAGDPSYESIKDRVNAAWTAAGRPATDLVAKTTVADCFRLGRRRLSTDLVAEVVRALHPDPGYVAQWRQALLVASGERGAASQVRVQDRLPPDLPGFTGRAAEMRELRRLLGDGRAVVISAFEGMAGVGKTRLAVHAGHRFGRHDRVLFVDLRGFHPDPAQPPADPAAVLEGFLRLLGVPGQRIPHDLAGRAAAYRDRLAGTRALVVLDNAADADQVRPLLPGAPGCTVLVTSRRRLADLAEATHFAVDVFTPEEAVRFLAAAAPGIETGDDPGAAARIAARCGHLPLALALVSGHMRARPGWTLTDHADRLDERHVETGVEPALDLSYRNLPAGRQRLLRLLALHPGPDLDAYAAAALAGTTLDAARADLRHLGADHLLQEGTAGRYTFHDLVRAYATGRALDEDPRPERRAALTRLFDHYLGAAAAAMDGVRPAEAHVRPRIPLSSSPAPELSDPGAALAWLDAERPTLVAVAAHTAAHGWPAHTTRLSRTLYRYLTDGHDTDALTVCGHAHRAAREAGDRVAEGHALTDLGSTCLGLARYETAAEHLRHALGLFRESRDPAGQARARNNLGMVAERLADHPAAVDHYEHAIALYREVGDRTSEARALNNLGSVEGLLGRYEPAVEHFGRAVTLLRRAGDPAGEASALAGLGYVEVGSGRYEEAGRHLRRALALSRRIALRTVEADALDVFGLLHTRLGDPDRGAGYLRRAVTIFHKGGYRYSEAWSLTGLGEAHQAAGRPADAVAQHAAALAIAVDIGARELEARAHAGLTHAHESLGDPVAARDHRERARALYATLGIQPQVRL